MRHDMGKTTWQFPEKWVGLVHATQPMANLTKVLGTTNISGQIIATSAENYLGIIVICPDI